MCTPLEPCIKRKRGTGFQTKDPKTANHSNAHAMETGGKHVIPAAHRGKKYQKPGVSGALNRGGQPSIQVESKYIQRDWKLMKLATYLGGGGGCVCGLHTAASKCSSGRSQRSQIEKH